MRTSNVKAVIAELWETWRLPVLGVAAVAIGVGAQFDGVLKGEAVGALLVLPAIATFLSIKDISGWLGRLAIAVGCTVCVLAALEVLFVSFPGEPITTASLSENETTEIDLPRDVSDFEIDTTATLASDGRQAHGAAILRLEREGHVTRVTPEFSHTSGRRRVGRRAVKLRGFNAQQIVRDRVSLPGSGTLAVRLTSTSGAVLPKVSVALRRVPLWSRALPIVMAVAALLTLIIQVIAARRGIKTFAAAGIGIGVVLGPYLQQHFNPPDLAATTVGALFVAIFIGGGGGAIACLATDKLTERART